jgi:DNA-directed RNA polymerase subunit RPC12/RpoP
MGIFSMLFGRKPKTINVEGGLDYRVVNPFKVEVIIGPEFRDAYEDSFSKKPSREYAGTIRRLNAAAALANDGEAYAVSEVLLAMDHFCEKCGEELTTDDTKCDNCGTKAFKGRRPIEMVLVNA